MTNNLYIVPYDFTPVTHNALLYAIDLAEKVGAEIRLIHILSDKSKTIAAKQKLESVVADLTVSSKVILSTYIQVGDVFVDIGKIAKKTQAQLIIMGTHGMKGFQKLSGSFAMKVVTNSECPLLIIQKDTAIQEIQEIAVPIDLTKESLQIINTAGDMANIYNATVHILAEKPSDAILNTRLSNRIGLITKKYEEKSVKHVVNYLPKSGPYSKKISNFVNTNNVGMLALSYHTESLLPQFDSFAQNLITNKANIPTLIINSKLASALYF